MILEYELESFFSELVEEYLSNKRNEFSKLDSAVKEKDFSTIKVIGHNLAGTGGSYGLSSLTDLGDKLENAAEVSDVKICEAILNDYKTFLDTVKVTYKS